MSLSFGMGRNIEIGQSFGKFFVPDENDMPMRELFCIRILRLTIAEV